MKSLTNLDVAEHTEANTGGNEDRKKYQKSAQKIIKSI